MRVGIGYDAHRLVKERPLILGGVNIPHTYGLLGHSDADVLVHAICDALLGAAALGDIGQHFPDNQPQYRGISSLILLAEVKQKINQQGWQISNIDSVIIAEQPKIAPYINAMRENLARCLDIDISQVGVKATSTEGMGYEGRQEGISAQAIALLHDISK
ncbi:MAG: 2-C-methyl-D-erythritol 2,4-cyclodiphosphate synthase [Syntrophomonadaceae bacterium]|nr:2-C-methyl-D-erythritol 2,4-cyclodiphosphate synthase [Syntrophomonadaceae bacterium]